MSAIIEAQGLSKWFGEVVAVNNLDVSIEPGVTGLLGPNGAGKSTFIKLALGLYSPSRGTMSVFGEPPRNNLRVLRRIGYCPEFDRFPENTTGYEFVYWLNRFYGMTGAEATRRAEEACERVKMTERMDDLIETYSRGMRQRIKIAQALAPSPELLFLDEPMAGLDPEGREEMFALIRELGENGRAVIVSSHILYEIERVTSHVVLLHNGCILARGRVHDMRELIDEHPLAVTVGCGSPRDLARHFAEDGATLSIEFEDGRVTVRTRDPNGFFEKLNRLVADKAVDVTSFACADADLQSVFQYLVR
ncbi:MAG TPA: ABC transporter ATP-binding protein [Candidatus Hydrogenedentes bacterium]|jgi:ABC-2 type transport system ATP-binding protein|nr:ABC transporter ATP-binding protein [Candidatus Hydrogenedentota bacterium]MDY0030662.1 ABC transporter ATP-binding protein [FCB group bacterium]NLT60075.1 ABC transporter ATP-binding protein [Candidatus Hydrogenedentota bacterium]HNZ17175.1 ABC transporter ATP-binding protein [Candidatus Hydrogenedentota bacterium]HOH32885.1 ABC transporter ATP-binding protein [Candidatus Hydrogenedentota bacterium]